MVENFVETVEATLPPEATIVKTIGDEVMVVSPDAASLTRVGGRVPRARSRAPAAPGRDPLRRGGLPRRRLLRQPGQPRPPGRQPGSRGRGAGHRPRRRRDRRARRALEFEPIGEVNLKGFPEPTALVLCLRGRGSTRDGRRRMLEAVRAGGAPGRRRRRSSSMLSGGRDSVCLLDVAVRLLGPAEVARPARQLRPARGLRRGRAPLRGALRAARGRAGGRAAAPSGGARQPAGLGARRPLRRRRAHRRCPTGRRSPPATPPTIRSRRSSTGSPPRRAAARCSACAPATGACVRPLLGFTRAQTTAYCEERGLAWREDTTNAEPTYARNRVRHGLVPALARFTRRRRPTCCAPPSCCARGRGARRPRRRRARRSARHRGDAIALERSAELPPALRRLVVQQLADRAAGRPVPGAARHAEEVAGLRRTGTAMLDLGGGVRAVAERGVLRAERPRPPCI